MPGQTESQNAMDGLKRIYARNCEVRKITRTEADPFLDENHQLGSTKCRYLYGLFVIHKGHADVPEGAMVAVAGFSSPRIWQKGERTVRSCEWVRYASLKGLGVDGGMGKVLKAFLEEVHPDDVMSYADAAWSDGDVYRKLGFKEEESKTFPNGNRSLKFRLQVNV